MLSNGASSLQKALNTRDPDWIGLAEEQSKHVLRDGGICLHHDAKNRNHPKQVLKNYASEIKKNRAARRDQKHPNEERNPLAAAEILSEIKAFPQNAGKNYCVREGADDIHN